MSTALAARVKSLHDAHLNASYAHLLGDSDLDDEDELCPRCNRDWATSTLPCPCGQFAYFMEG